MTTQQLTSRRQHALDTSAGLLDRVLGCRRYGWLVTSRHDPRREYGVTPDFRCDCPAGLAGAPCWHAAACYRLAYGLGAGRVTLKAQDAPERAQAGTGAPSVHDGHYQRPASHRTPDLGGEDDGYSLADMLAANRAA